MRNVQKCRRRPGSPAMPECFFPRLPQLLANGAGIAEPQLGKCPSFRPDSDGLIGATLRGQPLVSVRRPLLLDKHSPVGSRPCY